MSFRGKRRSVNTRPVRKAGVVTASRWSATHPAQSVGREVRSDDSRLDESSAGCPSTSCSPAELASVSPAVAILLNLNQAVQRKITAQPTVSKLVSHARGQAHMLLRSHLLGVCPLAWCHVSAPVIVAALMRLSTGLRPKHRPIPDLRCDRRLFRTRRNAFNRHSPALASFK
jgi:hypothetical protein